MNLTAEQEQRLIDIQQQAADGDLQAEAIVADAVDPESPLHVEFEWDDAKAAHTQRLETARQIMRARIYVEHGVLEIPVPRYIKNPDKPAHEQGMIDIAVLQTKPASARKTVAIECARVESAMRRLLGIVSVLGGTDLVEELLAKLEQLKALALEPGDDDDDAPATEQHPSL